jgi:hypothetical protein
MVPAGTFGFAESHVYPGNESDRNRKLAVLSVPVAVT